MPPIAIKDFVDQMTDQRFDFHTYPGKWTLGQTIYLEVSNKGNRLFRNRPVIDQLIDTSKTRVKKGVK